jgi:hypothetical protein
VKKTSLGRRGVALAFIRTYFHGNSPLRPAVTALAPQAVAPTPESRPAVETAADDPQEAIRRSTARYLWVMLLARLFDAFPLTCPLQV